jgi:ssDNA-binding Zn-finger/Zn-ribbon topoisomerase 1
MKPHISASRHLVKQVALLIAAVAPAAFASEVMPTNSKILHPWPGGVDPRPAITSVADDTTSDNLLLKWSGLSGPYRIQKSDAVSGGTWSNVGDPTTDNTASVPVGADGMGIFRVQGAQPDYVGQSVCRGCHPTAHDGWAETVHASALGTLKAIGQHNNKTCLPCHSVGYGLPGGFVSEAATPRLGGVQCENCHGPSANHISDPGDLNARPVVSLAGTLCGGCHNGFHHPTFDEWLEAGHAKVDADFTGASGFLNPNVVAGVARMRACGSCHGGAVRLAMLDGATHNPPVELPDMPSGDVAAKTGITCSVCHTAHEKTEYGSQLRNPTYSTNFFSYYTATNTNFTLQYNKEVQICAQCHNQRGAAWSGTGRPPHHSPQYNVLIGNIGDAQIAGLDLSSLPQSSHRDVAKQCTHCHTHSHHPDGESEENPVYTGHEFKPYPENCVPCHTAEEAEVFIGFRQRTTKAQIAELKAMLDEWGTTKAPEPLRTKYGKTAWEFTSVGQISRPPGAPAVTAPSASEQSLVPDDIKKARFVAYMIEHDGSYGVHNARFSTAALEEAKKLVKGRLTE